MISKRDQNQDCIMIKTLLMICANAQDLFKLADFNACAKHFFIFLQLIML